MVGQMPKHLPQSGEFRKFPVDFSELGFRYGLHIRALALLVAVERKELSAFLHREAKASGPLQEAQAIHVVE